MSRPPAPADPARSMALLWRTSEPPSRARGGPPLTVDAIVAAAVSIADADGIEAMTVRRVAERLGASAMSLYTYVPGRATLLDLMLDHAYGEEPRPPLPAEWPAALELVGRQNYALYLRHPWLQQVTTGRPVLGPNVIAKYDYELGAVEGVGLDDVEMDAVLELVLSFVRGAARGAVDAVRVQRESGLTEQQWWDANAPCLARVFDPALRPLASRVGTAAGQAHGAAYGPQHAFEFGLARVLDGVAVHVASHPGNEPSPPQEPH